MTYESLSNSITLSGRLQIETVAEALELTRTGEEIQSLLRFALNMENSLSTEEIESGLKLTLVDDEEELTITEIVSSLIMLSENNGQTFDRRSAAQGLLDLLGISK